MPDLNELADNLDRIRDKVLSIGTSDLSPAGQATAIALLVTLNIGSIEKAAAALRSRATLQPSVSEIAGRPQPKGGQDNG